jgi:hypothetical protein
MIVYFVKITLNSTTYPWIETLKIAVLYQLTYKFSVIQVKILTAYF